MQAFDQILFAKPSLRRFASLSGILLLALGVPSAGYAQSPVGDWITVDDHRNLPRSRVTIYEENGLLYARVDSVFLFAGEPADPVCIACEGDRKDRPIHGLVILWDMAPDGDAWSGGRILDPENGKTYRCKLWLDDGLLRVRGYWGPFHRTQTWHPAE